MKISLKYFLIVFFLIAPFGCKKEKSDNSVDFQFSYYPMNKGYSLIYNVTDITIDTSMEIFDTNRYQLKEKFESFFYDNSGNIAWRLERFKRTDSSQNWTISDVWETQMVKNQLQIVEENQRYVKIVFPPHIGMQWDGNALNTTGFQQYEVTDLDVQTSINQLVFDSTLTVTHQNSESLIDKYYFFSQYAKHIGLINKTEISIDYAPLIPNVPIMQRIARGHLYYQTLTGYSNE